MPVSQTRESLMRRHFGAKVECWGDLVGSQCEQTERCKGADGPVGPEKSVLKDGVVDEGSRGCRSEVKLRFRTFRDRGRLFVLLFGGRGLGAEKERYGRAVQREEGKRV